MHPGCDPYNSGCTRPPGPVCANALQYSSLLLATHTHSLLLAIVKLKQLQLNCKSLHNKMHGKHLRAAEEASRRGTESTVHGEVCTMKAQTQNGRGRDRGAGMTQ